jgi:nitrile hydratase subunit beta
VETTRRGLLASTRRGQWCGDEDWRYAADEHAHDHQALPSVTVGQLVRARHMTRVGHTRQPRFVRSRSKTIERDRGVFLFPDTNAYLNGGQPQHVHSVRSSPRELWGNEARPQDCVHLDLFDDCLEPA